MRRTFAGPGSSTGSYKPQTDPGKTLRTSQKIEMSSNESDNLISAISTLWPYQPILCPPKETYIYLISQLRRRDLVSARVKAENCKINQK